MRTVASRCPNEVAIGTLVASDAQGAGAVGPDYPAGVRNATSGIEADRVPGVAPLLSAW